MRWELWICGFTQFVLTALLLSEKPSDVELRVWISRIVDYGLYVVLLTALFRKLRPTGEVTIRRMIEFGVCSAAVLAMKYVGSWFYMEKTSFTLATAGAACLYALWFVVVIGIVTLLWYGAISALQMARQRPGTSTDGEPPRERGADGTCVGPPEVAQGRREHRPGGSLHNVPAL